MDSSQAILTRPEAAKALRIGVATLDRLAARGRIRPVRIPSPTGGRPMVRYTPAEIDRFLRQSGEAA